MRELKIKELSIEQKIGLLIVARGFIDETDRDFIFEMLKKKSVGGIQVRCDEHCETVIKQVNNTANYPVLICADMEYGYPRSQIQTPVQMALSATGNRSLVYESARVTAIEAKNAGYNTVWGPIVDICCPGALCKVTRTFGDDPSIISEFAGEMIRAYQDEGMVVTAKHFPGGHDMVDDPHMKTGFSNLSELDLEEQDLIPYLHAMKKEALSGIMTGHVLMPKIDPIYPASLSQKIISIIRKHGFDGVIMTDSMAMMGICREFGEKESLGLAIAAGNDMVLPSYRLSFKESYDALLESYHKGIISDERLDEAVRRVLAAQHLVTKPASASTVSDTQRETIRNISKESICALTQDGIPVKLDPTTNKVFVLFCENNYFDENFELKEVSSGDWFSRINVIKTKDLIASSFPGSEIIIANEFPNSRQIERICVAADNSDEVIFFTFSKSACYQASDGLTRRVEYLIRTLLPKTAAIVHIGNPYALKPFKETQRLIFGFPGGECERYAVLALCGEFTPSGRLPVHL